MITVIYHSSIYEVSISNNPKNFNTPVSQNISALRGQNQIWHPIDLINLFTITKNNTTYSI